MEDSVQTETTAPEPQPFDAVVDAAFEESGDLLATPESADLAPSVPPTADVRTAPAPVAEEPTFTYNPSGIAGQGRQFKLSELIKDPELMRTIVTSANQMPNIKSLYDQLLDRTTQRVDPSHRPPPPNAAPAPPGSRLDPRALQLHYEPRIKKMVEEGWVSPDFAEAFGPEVTTFLYQQDLLMDTRQALGNLLGAAQEIYTRNTTERVSGEVDALIMGLKDRGGLYADIGDPAKAQAFRDWVITSFEPTVGAMRNPENLAKWWIAYNSDDYAQRVSAALDADKRNQDALAQRRRNARGVPTGARPAGGGPAPVGQPWDAVVDAELSGG